MKPAAFQGTFADFRIVKGRKVAQFTIETPLENAMAALESLGGVPNPASEVWVACARIQPIAQPEKPKGKTASQRAWILCETGTFIDWFVCVRRLADVETPRAVAEGLRAYLGITSRGELDTNPEALSRFESLEREYQESMR